MKIHEIIDSTDKNDTISAIKYDGLYRFDKLYDYIESVTDEFNVPVEFLNKDMREEWIYELSSMKNAIIQKFYNSPSIAEKKWADKIIKILKYLEGK